MWSNRLDGERDYLMRSKVIQHAVARLEIEPYQRVALLCPGRFVAIAVPAQQWPVTMAGGIAVIAVVEGGA